MDGDAVPRQCGATETMNPMHKTTKIGLLAALMLLSVAAASTNAAAFVRPGCPPADVDVDTSETDIGYHDGGLHTVTGASADVDLACEVNSIVDPIVQFP